jgi:hypothetical protein
MTAVPPQVAAVVERYRQERDRAKYLHDYAVLGASQNKEHMPDGYWQQAHDAEQRYLTALIVASAFEAEP